MNPVSVLIVDDDEALSQALVTKLSGQGYQTTVAKDGDEAIALLTAQKFNVVLTDLHMPHKSGIEVLKAMAGTMNKATPSYVITNLGSDQFCEEALANGAKKCFVKSRITLSEVVDIIQAEL